MAGVLARDARAGLPARDVLWQAVLHRDARFDGVLVYGVTSTGIYCRPSCASRKPRPGNAVFFAGPTHAEADGFRACTRCQPNTGTGVDPDRALVLAACRFIELHESRNPTLREIGEQVGLSPGHLQKQFTRTLGVSPKEYADALRTAAFRRSVRQGDGVTGALYDAGYGSSSRLYERAAERLGMTPGRYRRQGAGEIIHYQVVPSALGPLLVAATSRGLCSVRFGGDEDGLRGELRQEFGSADLVETAQGLKAWTDALVNYLAGESRLPALPLDVQATAFQARVWRALRRIPDGVTATYEAVARAIGQPRAARAVAGACAANPVALGIPCHRVVPRRGGVGGYRWGTHRKQALLAGEARRAAQEPRG